MLQQENFGILPDRQQMPGTQDTGLIIIRQNRAGCKLGILDRGIHHNHRHSCGGSNLNTLSGGIPFHRRHKNSADTGIHQFLHFLILTFLIHGSIPRNQYVSVNLKKCLNLSIQHLEVRVVHGHIGRPKGTLSSPLTGG